MCEEASSHVSPVMKGFFLRNVFLEVESLKKLRLNAFELTISWLLSESTSARNVIKLQSFIKILQPSKVLGLPCFVS